MLNIIEDENLRNKISVFKDRSDAGKKLSQFLSVYRETNSIILSIPSGGVPVAKELKNYLLLDLDLLIVRKIQIPWNPEAGFGAMNLDGDVVFNDQLIRSLELSEYTINNQIERTKEILIKRNKLFRKGRPFPSLKNKIAILVDDGLASGYTMIAAIKYVKKRNPEKIIVAVPTGSYNTVKRVSEMVDHLYCLNIREGYPFAVADAYINWYDLSDEEVLKFIENKS